MSCNVNARQGAKDGDLGNAQVEPFWRHPERL